MNFISLYIAFRYFRSKKRGFPSFVSIMSFMGITLGVAVLILVTSVMNGFEKELEDRVLQAIPHASIKGSPLIDNWSLVNEVLNKNSNILGSSPYIETQGLINSENNLKGIFIYGVDPKLEKKISTIPNNIIVGSWDNLLINSYDVILGDILAMQLGVNIGDYVNILVPDTGLGILGTSPRVKRFKVSAIFSIGSPEVDQSFVYINIKDAAKLLRIKNKVHGVRVRYTNLFNAKKEIKEDLLKVQNTLSGKYKSQDWTKSYGTLFRAIKMEKFLVSFLLFLVVLVAIFNLVSMMVMTVNEKRPQIAILMTMGAKPSTIQRIFIFFGSLIGFLGTFFGTILGLLLSFNLGSLISFIETTLNISLLDAYFINYFPIDIRASWVITICLISITMTILSSLYPSLIASKSDPATILRHE